MCCASGRLPSTYAQLLWKWKLLVVLCSYCCVWFLEIQKNPTPVSKLVSSFLQLPKPWAAQHLQGSAHSSLSPAQKSRYLFPTDVCYNREPTLFSYCAQSRPLISQSQKSCWRVVCWLLLRSLGQSKFFPFLSFKKLLFLSDAQRNATFSTGGENITVQCNLEKNQVF